MAARSVSVTSVKLPAHLIHLHSLSSSLGHGADTSHPHVSRILYHATHSSHQTAKRSWSRGTRENRRTAQACQRSQVSARVTLFAHPPAQQHVSQNVLVPELSSLYHTKGGLSPPIRTSEARNTSTKMSPLLGCSYLLLSRTQLISGHTNSAVAASRTFFLTSLCRVLTFADGACGATTLLSLLSGI